MFSKYIKSLLIAPLYSREGGGATVMVFTCIINIYVAGFTYPSTKEHTTCIEQIQRFFEGVQRTSFLIFLQSVFRNVCPCLFHIITRGVLKGYLREETMDYIIFYSKYYILSDPPPLFLLQHNFTEFFLHDLLLLVWVK